MFEYAPVAMIHCQSFTSTSYIYQHSADGLTTRTYSFTANPTCQGEGTLAWTRPRTCAPTVINGVVSSDMQTVKCIPSPARRVWSRLCCSVYFMAVLMFAVFRCIHYRLNEWSESLGVKCSNGWRLHTVCRILQHTVSVFSVQAKTNQTH